MTTTHSLFFAVVLAVTHLVPCGLSAAPADSRITAVTVYLDRAVVTRTASAEFGAGEHTLTFENLPATLNDQSLSASGKGVAGASILDVVTVTVFTESAPNERVREIEDQQRTLQQKTRMLDDRGKNLSQQREFVERLLQAPSATGAGGPAAPAERASLSLRPSLEEWQKLLTYADETFGKIATEQLSLDNQREELQAKKAVLDRQLNEFLRVARGRQSKTVRVRVALTAPGQLEIAIQYAVPNASWTPSYDARLQSADRSVALSYFGIVRNGTGEDWNDIDLTLSTARPGLGGGAPELRPWIAEVARPQAVTGSFQNSAATQNAVVTLQGQNNGVFVQPRGRGADAASELLLNVALVDTGVTSATFRIPVTVNLPGNNVTQKVAINTSRLIAALQFQSTPKALEAAFLNASALNDSDYPLLAGPMNTFLDGTFVASSALKTVMPGEKFEVALGADEGIKIKRRVVNRFQEDTGFTNKGRRVTYEILVTVTNNKTTPERLVFREPTPVSRDEKIIVKVLSPTEKEVGTLASPKEVTREEDGKIVWRVNLKPGEKREFPLKVSVEYPADIAVIGLE